MKTLRPLRDNVVVKRIEYKHARLYVHGQKLDKGEVVAVGPGRRMRRKTPFYHTLGKQERAIMFEDGNETGVIRPMRVKVGDIVEFGFRQQTPVTLDGVEYILIPEQSIYGKTTAAQDTGMFGKKSAGFDKQGQFIA